MLNEIAPSVQRAALIGNPYTASDFDYFLEAAETLAPSLAIKIVPVRVGNIPINIERAIETFARQPNGSLVLPPDGTTIQNRDLIVGLAARHRLPAVYAFRLFVTAGGLMSYATDLVDQYRRAAAYVDRILRGADPADLPVQAPTKYETIVNLRTAKALGLAVPSGPACSPPTRLSNKRLCCCDCSQPLLAHRCISRRRSNSVAFGAKRTFSEPRLREPDLSEFRALGRRSQPRWLTASADRCARSRRGCYRVGTFSADKATEIAKHMTALLAAICPRRAGGRRGEGRFPPRLTRLKEDDA